MNVSTKYLSQFKTFSSTRRSPLGCGKTGLSGSVDTFLWSALDVLSLGTCGQPCIQLWPIEQRKEKEKEKEKASWEEMPMWTNVYKMSEWRTFISTSRRDESRCHGELSCDAGYCGNADWFLAIPRHTEDILGLPYINSSLGGPASLPPSPSSSPSPSCFATWLTPRHFCCLATT